MTIEEKERTKFWLSENVTGINNNNPSATDYELKHMLQDDTGVNLSSEDFDEVMTSIGYKSFGTDGQKSYNVSRKSKCFLRYKTI